MITNIKEVLYNVKYFWNIDYNPNATIPNALPNCTTCAYGLIIAEHLPPVKAITDASNWDTVLTNGWMAIDYDEDKLEVGDILQWKKKNHVATISRKEDGKVFVSSSAYTGEHGVSMYNGSYDTRKSFKTLEQLSNFMYANYPTRMFHCWSKEDEFKFVGGIANKILKHPLYSVEKNQNRNQIEVLTYEQNVRDNNNNILKKAEKGFFNVISTRESEGYIWYEVEENKYIAGVDGRVVFYPKKDDENLIEENNRLKEENASLKNKLDEIRRISNYE